MEDSLMLACHPTHPLATQSSQVSVQWRQLLGQRLILLSKGSGLRQLVEQTLNKQPLKAHRQVSYFKTSSPAQHSYEVAHVATAVGLVRSGEGISVLPAYALTRALAEQRHSLTVLPLINPVVKRKVVALASRQRPLPDSALQFLQHVKHQLAS
jgi:DNA-binding transcriptional LysR family regulator